MEQETKDVTLQIPPGIYHESLFIDTSLSDPTLSDRAGRGLRLEGDLRPIAAMTYIHGGQLMTDPAFTVNSGLNSLGEWSSGVTLTASGYTITVSTTGVNPNFKACGVVPGDMVLVTNKDGTVRQGTIKKVSGNTITHDIPSLIISGNGAALTFCPNVQVQATSPDYMVNVVSGAVEVIGVWFSIDPASPAYSSYGIKLEGTGQLYGSRYLIDGRNLQLPAFGFYVWLGGQVIVGTSEDTQGHISLIGAQLEILESSMVVSGDWYVMATPSQESCIAQSGNSLMTLISSIQINGNNNTIGYSSFFNDALDLFHVLTVFNCYDGVQIGVDCSAHIFGSALVDSCLNRAIFVQDGNLFYARATPLSLNNSSVAIQVGFGGEVILQNPVDINSCITGISLLYGSTFMSDDNVIFSGVANPYAIDSTSYYLTNNNEGTDPSPNNAYTYSTAGNVTMNSAYLTQLLGSGGIINLTMDPTTLVSGVKIYQGKTYTLVKTSGGSHTFTLTGGATFPDGSTSVTFSGPAGALMTIEVLIDNLVVVLNGTGINP